MDLRPSRSTRYLPIVLMLAIGLALVGLVMLAVPATQASPAIVPVASPTITPVAGVNYQLGNFCMDDFGGNSCTANDVEIASLTPSLSDVCLSSLPGETATIQFKAEIRSNATERYDIGLFIATEGGSALVGTACYHDFLQPVTTGVPDLTGGYGPFRQIDGIPTDICGDTRSVDGNIFYFTQVPVTVSCVDVSPQDGVVDDISTCVSWDNNANGTCTNVTQAGAGTGSKCRCEPKPSGVLIYRGLDYGDLPDTTSGTGTGNYQTLKSYSGPSHAVQDSNNDGTPDTIGGVPAVWLGDKIDIETDGQPNDPATGDDTNLVYPGVADDEDGVSWTSVPQWTTANGYVDVTVSHSGASACTALNPCKLAIYVDWDNNGDFLGANESSIQDVVDGPNNDVSFPGPGSSPLPSPVYARFRLYRVVPTLPSVISPTGLALNGEVEDYKIDVQPLGVTLANFSAMCTGGQPEISWETVSELNTLGFNVWRNTSDSGPQDKLNNTMIPAHPGSAQGYTYSFTDTTAQANTTYYYWLEDIDTGNASTFHGPIEAQCQSPTSVGLDTVDANPVAGLPAAALPTAGLLALGAVGATAAWLRRRRA